MKHGKDRPADQSGSPRRRVAIGGLAAGVLFAGVNVWALSAIGILGGDGDDAGVSSSWDDARARPSVTVSQTPSASPTRTPTVVPKRTPTVDYFARPATRAPRRTHTESTAPAKAKTTEPRRDRSSRRARPRPTYSYTFNCQSVPDWRWWCEEYMRQQAEKERRRR